MADDPRLCRFCKYWDIYRDSRMLPQWGFCLKVCSVERLMDCKDRALLTSPTFGCVQWQDRKENG